VGSGVAPVAISGSGPKGRASISVPVGGTARTRSPLLSVPAHAAKVTTFNKECVENEATIVSLQPQPKQEALVIEGEACDRGQLTKEDLSYVESVQPANAVRVIRGAK